MTKAPLTTSHEPKTNSDFSSTTLQERIDKLLEPQEKPVRRKPSTLSDLEIKQIQKLLADQDCKRLTAREIAEIYNVSESAVNRISTGHLLPKDVDFASEVLENYRLRTGWQRIAYVIDLLTDIRYKNLSYADIGKLCNVSAGTVSYVQTRAIWKDLWEVYDDFVAKGLREKWPTNPGIAKQASLLLSKKTEKKQKYYKKYGKNLNKRA